MAFTLFSTTARTFKHRLAIASLATAVLFGPLAAKLFVVEALPTARHSAVVVAPHHERTFLSDLTAREAGDRLEFTAEFSTEYPQFLVNATKLDLVLATYRGSPTFDSAVVELDNGCRFVAAAPGTIVDNATMAFTRQTPCPPAVDSRLQGRIRILASKDARVAVLAVSIDPRDGHGLIRIAAPTQGGAGAYATGNFWPAPVAGTATASRLLAQMWRLPHHLFAAWLVACALIFFLALLARHVAAAAGGAALALAATYALVTPPFQAPDEPTHFLTFTQANARGDLRNDARKLADETHFNRIIFRTHEIFTKADAVQPWKANWSLGDWPAPGSRSRLVTWVWQAVGSAMPGTADAPFALLALRLFHSVVFAAAIGFGSLLVVSASATQASAFVALCPFFLMPILPYLGMFVSDHAALVSGYVLSGLVLTRMLIRRQIEAISVIVLAVTLAWLLASGRAALPALAFWIPALAFMIVKRWIPSTWAEAHSPKVAAVAFGGLAALCLYAVLKPGAPIPSLPAEGELPVSAARYVYLSLKEFLLMLAPQARRSWLMDFVWAGFGWLDAIPPLWFVDAGKLVALAGVVLTLFWSLRRPNPALWYLLGGVVCLAAYAGALAYGAYTIRANLHGRYVIGLFTLALPFAFMGWRETESRLRDTLPAYANAVVAFLVAACVLTHSYMLQSLIGRYFGV